MKGFEVGKRYKLVNKSILEADLRLVNDDATFVCHEVDGDGDLWTPDASFKGSTGCSWCISEFAEDGDIVEVGNGC